MDGGSISVLSCDENDKCLNPIQRTVVLPAEKAFRKRINTLIIEMATKLADGTRLEQRHQDLISKTSIPIYRMMISNQAYFKSSAANIKNADDYTSLVAIDMLYQYLDEILRQVKEQTKQITNYDQSNIDKFEIRVDEARKELMKFKNEQKVNLDDTMKMIEQQRTIESILSSQFSGQMKNNLIWAKKY